MKHQDPYRITADTYSRIATLYRDVFMDLELYNDTYDLFCGLVNNPQGRVFEIGCGPGNITRYMHTKQPGWKIDAIDVAPGMIEIARELNPDVNFSVMDCRDIGRLDAVYDGIVCGFCLPYLSITDCSRLMNNCRKLLAPGGILYFSLVLGEESQSGFKTGRNEEDQVYFYYHQEDELMKLLEENKFTMLHRIDKDYGKPGNMQVHTIFIAGSEQ